MPRMVFLKKGLVSHVLKDEVAKNKIKKVK